MRFFSLSLSLIFSFFSVPFHRCFLVLTDTHSSYQSLTHIAMFLPFSNHYNYSSGFFFLLFFALSN